METRDFGPTGLQVPVIGQGTWYLDQAERATAVAALQAGIAAGARHIDTAEMYGEGAAEEIVRDAIVGRRRDVFLVSKVLPGHATRPGTMAACEASLLRLGTDYLDCYLLHWRGPLPLEPTIEAFDDLQASGKIRSWGVSNFDADDLEDVVAIAGEERVACNQVLYHLQERAIEHAVLPWCEEHGVAVVAYSPLGHGRFPGPRTPGGRILRDVAAAHGATPRQVALRFVVRRPPLFAVPKASTPEHAVENARAGDLRLTADELAALDAAFPVGPRPRTLPTL